MIRHPSFLRRPRLAALLCAMLLGLAPATGPAVAASSGGGEQGGGKKADSGPSRDDAAQLSGQYIMLDPVWVPVVDTARQRTFTGGLLIRLEPAPEHRVDVCYLVPRLVDALVTTFFQNPITRDEQLRKEPVRKRVQTAVDTLADKSVMAGISVFEQMPELDDDSLKLTRTCR